MRTHLDIIKDISYKLYDKGLDYEFKSFNNEVSRHLNSTELIGEVGSVLLKMSQKAALNDLIGDMIIEFIDYADKCGIRLIPSKFYSLDQKVFEIDGTDFSDLKGFYNSIGQQLVDQNKWGKNWNALNDILKGGFIKTEYGEPFKLIWKNSEISKSNFEDYKDIINLIRENDHIDLELK
jgi:RNAse (barnase) inhibitor barstar